MIATFRETIASLKDLKYGQEIVKKSLGQALWYWTKYLLLVAVIGLGIAIAVVTYYTPQLPKFLEKQLPDLDLTLKDGKASSTAKQPYVQGDKDFVFILNTKGKAEDLEGYKSGVIVLQDKVVAKKSDTETQTYSFKDFGNFTISKKIILDWLGQNQPAVLGIGLALVLVIALIFTGISWMTKLSGFFISAILIWVLGLILKKSLSYTNAVKLAIYASVLPLLFSIFSTGNIGFLLQLTLFLIFAIGWLWYLPGKKK